MIYCVKNSSKQLMTYWKLNWLRYDPYARAGWNTGNSRNGAYFRKVDTQFGEIEIQVPRDRNGMFHQHTLPSTPMSWSSYIPKA